jgi:hypothetical protein
MSVYALWFPIWSYVGFTRKMGNLVGEKFFTEIKQLRCDEEATEAVWAEIVYRVLGGIWSLALYLLPFTWICYLMR